MSERKHNLPSRFSRLDDQITGPVADAIAVRPRSHGRLCLPGEWSTGSRPQRHEVTVTSSDPDNRGVCTEQRLAGRGERYTVTYDVWNYRDSPAVARIILTGQAGTTPPDPLGR